MTNYRLCVQYDGARYRGWQRQGKTSADTIQSRLEALISRLTGEDAEVHGAGRTDAGVHARGQVAHVRLECGWEPEVLAAKMNEYLPEDIRILEVQRAGERFHSRLNATGKVYEYHLLKKGCYDVFARKYSWQMERDLDTALMRKGAELLTGSHDFRGFCTKASRKKSTVRRLDAIDIRETERDIFLRFEGNGFLYNMVRILVGTLVEIGDGRRAPDSIREIFAVGDRRLAGGTAPAQGLTLLSVRYD